MAGTHLRNVSAWLGLGALLAAARPAAAQLGPLQSWPGQHPLERCGWALANVGDLNQDGQPDLAVGVPLDPVGSVETGSVRVVSGAGNALLLEASGGAALDHFGWSVSAAGDWNQDGRGDLAVGAPDADWVGPDSGAVWVLSGLDGSLLHSFYGAGPFERLGMALHSAGDLDGDGGDELLLGAPFAAGERGRVELRASGSGALLWSTLGNAPGDRLGTALAGGADLDQDGTCDWLVGCDQGGLGTGYVLVIDGFSKALVHTLWGASPGGRFGASLAMLTALPSASGAHFAVGAPAAQETGRVTVFHGLTRAVLAGLGGSSPQEQFGHSLCCAGDVDQDGFADLAVGSPYSDQWGASSGSVRLYSSANWNLVNRHVGAFGGDRFGWALAPAGDLDQDGRADLWIGAPKQDLGFADGGAVHAFSGRDSSPFATCRAKLNSLSCTPHVGWLGAPQLSATVPFEVACWTALNQRPGLFFWGLGPLSAPFHGGTLCVAPPLVREALQDSGGSVQGSDCTGSYWQPFWPSGFAASGWTPGLRLRGQFWMRDPAHPDGTGVGLSDALEWVVGP
jgi:hypothetical protein